MDPPAYFELPPTYKEEKARPASVKSKADVGVQTELNLVDVTGECCFLVFMFLLVAAMTALFITLVIKEYENKLHDQVIKSGSTRLFLDGNSTIVVNGSQFMTPSGLEYRVTLPSYNVAWPSERHVPEVVFSVHVEGEATLTRAKKDAHLCEGEGTWCLTIHSQREINSPIVVDYVVMFPKKEVSLFFNRTFRVEQWKGLEKPLYFAGLEHSLAQSVATLMNMTASANNYFT